MKKFKINLIIIALTGTLAVMSVHTLSKYNDIQRQRNKSNIVDITEDINIIDKRILIEKLNDENQLMVLSGDTTVEITYSNKSISDEDVNFKWLKDKLENLSSKDLKVQANYEFQFLYDLEDLEISIKNNKPVIYLSKNRISSQVELIENKSIYIDRVGLFENSFTSNEINSLNGRTKDLVLNKIQSDKSLRDKAMQNVKINIDKILGIECDFILSDFDVISNQDNVNIVSNKNIKY